MFNKLFRSKPPVHAVDFSTVITDIHSHLIPGIDDGAKTMEESLYLIRRMCDLGFKRFITTPHIMNEFFKNTPEIIYEGLENLRQAVLSAGIPVSLEASAEYLVDIDFENKYKSGRLMTFGDNYLLIELPYLNYPQNLKNILFDLQLEGYKIILAHPERYNYWHSNYKVYQELKDRNIYFQLNTISLSGYYSGQVRDISIRLINDGLIEFIGTDMHNENYMQGLEKSRYELALAKLLDSGRLLNASI